MANDGTGGRSRRPGRPRPDQPVLTRSAILAAALKLVDEDGIEALSMRRLATRLGVDPMSIYHHVPNKAALLSELVRLVFASMPTVDAAEMTWDDRVRAWARDYLALALAHPGLVLQIVTDSAAASEAAVLISEPLYAAFSSAGLAPWQVVRSVGTLVDFVNGYALAMVGPAATGTNGGTSMADRLAAIDPDQVPTMRHVHAQLATAAPDPRGAFEVGVDIIIHGSTVD